MLVIKVEFFIVYVAYIVAAVVDLIRLAATREASSHVARWTIVGAVVLHTVVMLTWVAVKGSTAIVQPFGALVTLTWAVVLVMLIVRFRYGLAIHEPVLLLLVIVLLTLAHARPSNEHLLAGNYVAGFGAALFPLHLVACYFGYAAFANAFAISAEYLALHWALKHRNLALFQGSHTSLESLDRINTWLLTVGVVSLATGVVAGLLWMQASGTTAHGLLKFVASGGILLLYLALVLGRRSQLLVGRRMALASVGALPVVVGSFIFVG